jgi:hypothetical protein
MTNTKQLKENRGILLDILANSDGSGMDKTAYINQILSWHQAETEKVCEKLKTATPINMNRTYYTALDDVILALKEEKV